MLLTPLAKEAGGWGLCRNTDESTSSPERGLQGASTPISQRAEGNPSIVRAPVACVFASAADPGYQAILAMLVAGKQFLEHDSTRFDMPNFRPRLGWVREMKRYGLLPDCTKPDDVTDVYAAGRDYWKSLWYRPTALLQA